MYKDHKDWVKEFFECSLNGTMDEFDFEQAFEEFRPEIELKLSEHGLLGFEDYFQSFNEFHSARDVEQFAGSTGYIHITADEVLEAIARLHYEKAIEAFEGLGSFEELADIIECIDNADLNDTKAMVILFDRIIHAQHETGDIYDFDPVEIRADVEKEFNSLHKSRLAKFR